MICKLAISDGAAFYSRLTQQRRQRKTRFYQILAQVLRRYMAAHPDLCRALREIRPGLSRRSFA